MHEIQWQTHWRWRRRRNLRGLTNEVSGYVICGQGRRNRNSVVRLHSHCSWWWRVWWRKKELEKTVYHILSGSGGGRNWQGQCTDVKSLFLVNERNSHVTDIAPLLFDSSRNFSDSCCCLIYNRPPTVFEVIRSLWNSNDFNPIAPASEE
jgi:hypothetical protein